MSRATDSPTTNRMAVDQRIFALCGCVIFLSATARADDNHSVTASAIVGPELVEREFSPPKTDTIADTVTLSEQVALQYQWTKLLQPSLAFQTTHAVTSTEQPSRFTSWQIQPGIAISIGKPLTIGVDAVLAPRINGENKFGFGLQPRLGLNQKLGESKFSFNAQIQVPYLFTGGGSVSITPFVGLGYELYGG